MFEFIAIFGIVSIVVSNLILIVYVCKVLNEILKLLHNIQINTRESFNRVYDINENCESIRNYFAGLFDPLEALCVRFNKKV